MTDRCRPGGRTVGTLTQADPDKPRSMGLQEAYHGHAAGWLLALIASLFLIATHTLFFGCVTRDELSHDISRRSAGRGCRALLAATELSPGRPAALLSLLGGGSPTSTARTVTKTIFKESSVMATPAAASIGTSVQRALNGPLPQLDRRPPGEGSGPGRGD